MSNQHRNLAAASTAVKTRTELFNGREHIVVPVVALVEGVIQAMNASAPEFVAAEEFSKAPIGWNGRPVFVDHPVVNGVPVFGNQPSVLEKRQVGIVFNAAAKGGKLTMEAWIDIERAKEVAPELLERVSAGEPIEVSVGLLCETADETGEYNGKKYKGAWKDLIPDHLALLSKGRTGACSREMGCGVRAAVQRACVIKHEGEKWVLYSHDGKKKLGSFDSEEHAKKRERQINYYKKDAMRIDKTFGGIFARMMESFRGAQPSRDMTSGDLLRKLNDAVRKADPTVNYVETYLPVKNPNRVIYSCYHEGATPDAPYEHKLYERSFSLGTDGAITLGEDAAEVEPVMYYEPVVKHEEEEVMAAEEVKAACGCQHAEPDLRDLLREAADKFTN